MYGKFIENTAGYEIHSLNLPASWEYIYENRDILLKVDQFGPVYAQAHPPGDIMLFKRENHEKYSPWTVNINNRFTNFFRPNGFDCEEEPQDLKIEFLPEEAKYSFTFDNFAVSTEFIIPLSGTIIAMKFRLKNISDKKVTANIKPHFVPYFSDAVLAPWDKFEWYLDSECKKQDNLIFSTKLLNADANTDKRRIAHFYTDSNNLAGYELSLEKYIGQGDLSRPQFNYTNDERIYGYPPVYAAEYIWELEAGEEKELTQVLTLDEDGAKYFDNVFYCEKKNERKTMFAELFAKNSIKTNDCNFDYYANYWLPLQMSWVASLDRGWPTGMRGSRDSAQDYSALLYLDTACCREILLLMMECQRTDGWFPRQYSSKGKHGKHDLRTHVDGGAFFVEFIWKYLSHSKDWDILKNKVEWLDSDEKSTVLNHIIKAVEYYINPENLGEHGLCKIRGGDWLDAVNSAGLEGRGESVTVSEQTVMSLKYLADILTHIGMPDNASKYMEFAEKLKENINNSAFNESGYYNGVFNDNGEWIFSDNDPDGVSRMYSVSNYYAIISGIADKNKSDKILENAEMLKCDKGYRLFYPCFGETPIDKVGRIASGDLPPYLVENGNVYNHGSQGFFARALAVMGKGDMLFDVLQWLLPYNTQYHPTEKTFTPPYAIVNCWQQLPAFDHRGMMCFLTGSIAMGLRGVYEWLMGITPTLDGLEINPVLAEKLGDVTVKFNYMNKSNILEIKERVPFLNGKKLTEKHKNLITGKEVYYVKSESF